MRAIIIATIAYLVLAYPAQAQDHTDWIKQQGHRTKTGQLCYGNGDCEAIDPSRLSVTSRGYVIAGRVFVRVDDKGVVHRIGDADEVIPFAEAQPLPFSTDGRLWVCRSTYRWLRPETGGRRCVFGM